MKSTHIAAAIVAGAAVLAASPAFADPVAPSTSATDDIHLSLTVVQQCTIAVPDLTFDDAGMIDNDIDTSGTISVRCTDTSPYAITLSSGANSSDTDTRKLKATGGRTVDYQLYSDADHLVPWGMAVTGAGAITNAGANGATGETFPVYARVSGSQNVPAGVYTDTVTATIWYDGGAPPQ